MDDLILELYFDQAASYREDLVDIRNRCNNLQKDHNATFLQIERGGLSSVRTRLVENAIRGLIPQERGSIVTSRGFLLPLSNSKNLNLTNTPVLLVKSKEKLFYVFPCLIGETYFSVTGGLVHLLLNLPALPPLIGQMEETVSDRVLNDIDSFEKGLRLEGRDVDTSAGTADLVFLDYRGKHVVVEIEREATDNALGQILRLCAAYEKKFGLARDDVRAVIACLRIHEYIREASKRAGVEIWVAKT
ncbi:MAG: endonuclease NucS [archaeon]|nr:endonuclease NucS [archaeon]